MSQLKRFSMCLRIATIAILVATLFLPSESRRTYIIARNVRRPFLDGLSDDAKKAFWDVEKDDKLTLRQVREKRLEWAKKYGIQASFHRFYNGALNFNTTI